MAEIKGVLATGNLSTQPKEAEALYWWNSKKSKYPYSVQFVRRHISAPTSFVHSERLFSEVGNLYEQKRNRLLLKTDEKLYFSTTTCVSQNSLFIAQEYRGL